MNGRSRARRSILVGSVVALGWAGFGPAFARTDSPVVLHQGVVTRQDVASQSGSETDTVVEPDVAVSPIDKNVAVAAAHDSRYSDGGAVDISVAWTSNGGATWQHLPVQGITTATGGPYDRASDPVVAFGPDGTAYLSVLLIDASTCPSAVAVLRSTDGGQTWSKPFYAHTSDSCALLRRQELDRGRQLEGKPPLRTGLPVLDSVHFQVRRLLRLSPGGALVRRPGQDVEQHPLRHQEGPQHPELAADDSSGRVDRRHVLRVPEG